MPADKSKRIPIPDQPPTVNTFNPFPSPSSQGGPVIREINISNATSVRTVAAPPPHMRNSTGVRNNFQPVQLTPQPAVTVSESHLVLLYKCDKKQTETNLHRILETSTLASQWRR